MKLEIPISADELAMFMAKAKKVATQKERALQEKKSRWSQEQIERAAEILAEVPRKLREGALRGERKVLIEFFALGSARWYHAFVFRASKKFVPGSAGRIVCEACESRGLDTVAISNGIDGIHVYIKLY